jgi:hypothetical protein
MYQELSEVWIMAYTTIDDPSAYFQTALYTGNGGTQSITNDGNSDLQPDWVWTKGRSDADNNSLFDSSRGTTKELNTNGTGAEGTASGVTAFSSDGFTLGSNNGINGNTKTYVAWQWKANGGTTTSVSASGNGLDANTTKAGTYQANTTAGFSIVTFATGSISNGDHRINHGLGATPHFILTKSRDNAADWYTYHHKGTDDNDYLRLNLTNATSNASARNVFDGSDFTSTYFEMDYNNILLQNENFVAYCFTEVQGYSKFGSYTGNGNADGPFVYTGFKPAWVMLKSTDSANAWWINDTKRDTFNLADAHLSPDRSDAEQGTYALMDILSNGFKLRTSNGQTNGNTNNYIYMAFAESPFVSSQGVPTTAR